MLRHEVLRSRLPIKRTGFSASQLSLCRECFGLGYLGQFHERWEQG